MDIHGVIILSFILGEPVWALPPCRRTLLTGELHLMENCAITMQTWGQQSLLLGVNSQPYTEGLRVLSNTCLEVRCHVVSCISLQTKSKWGWELADRGSKTCMALSTAWTLFHNNYQEHVYLQLPWKKIWNILTYCLRSPGREDEGRGEGWGPSQLCNMCILVRAVCGNEPCWRLCMTDLGNQWHSCCLFSRTSTIVNLQHSLVQGLFKSPGLQAMAVSLFMYGSRHVSAGKTKLACK